MGKGLFSSKIDRGKFLKMCFFHTPTKDSLVT